VVKDKVLKTSSKKNLLSCKSSNCALLGVLIIFAQDDSGVAWVSGVVSITTESTSSSESASESASVSSGGSLSLGSTVQSNLSTVQVSTVQSLVGFLGSFNIVEFNISESSWLKLFKKLPFGFICQLQLWLIGLHQFRRKIL
jgi:hypothetical protein